MTYISIRWIGDPSNWMVDIEEVPIICGNLTGARHCPPQYTCLCVGPNPNHGYTNFDNFLWSMLTTFQLITLDYWENVYNMVSTFLRIFFIYFGIYTGWLQSPVGTWWSTLNRIQKPTPLHCLKYKAEHESRQAYLYNYVECCNYYTYSRWIQLFCPVTPQNFSVSLLLNFRLIV